jgi:outer membrane protein TolC
MILLVVPSSGQSDDPYQFLTLNDFLEQLRRNHPLFEKEMLSPEIVREDRSSLLGSQDWNLSSSFGYWLEEPATALLGPERMQVISADARLDRLFWKTGGRLSTSLSLSRVDMKIAPDFGVPDSYYQNQIGISYTHPLMQNRGGSLDRLGYDLKEYDIDYSELMAIENQEDFLAESGAKFLGWVLLTEQIRILKERMRLSEEELANTRKKRGANLIDEVDVIRATDAVRIAKQNLVLAESQWKARQGELAVLTQNDRLYDMNPQYSLYQREHLIPLDDATSLLKSDSRLITAFTIRLQQIEHTRGGFTETQKPDLSLLAEFSLKNADGAVGESFVMDKPDALVGVQLAFPLEKRTAKSQIARTDVQIVQMEKQIDELTIEMVSALTNVHILITEYENVLSLNFEQIESAESKTAEELKLYNQGRGQLTFVIQSRDSEQAAKLTYASNALSYHKLILQYRALMDQLYD